MKIDVLRCVERLSAADNFLIVTHNRPDGDTIGSACALCDALRGLGKTAHIFTNSGITDTYIGWAKEYFAPAGFSAGFTVATDVADTDMFPDDFFGKIDLSIDHHPSNSLYAGETVLIPEKASCGEIICDVITKLTGSLTKHQADLLYIALSTDTGCFCYGNTTADALRCAALLVDAGADNKAINKAIFRTVTMPRILLEGMIYSNLIFKHEGKTVIATVTLDMMQMAGATENDCEDLANIPGKIAGCLAGVTIRETAPGICKVSVRTGAEIDANAVCAKFGGGGHRMASGCTVSASPQAAAELFAAAIEEAM